MSLLGAMNTADSGLNAQSAAFTNISDNIANSQTVGYKGVTTSFADYLTSSTAAENQSGAVETAPQYENDVQGTITQSSDPLALAISGQGLFAVAETSGTSGNAFSNTQYYTRDGDFTQNTLGYLVNGSGEYLEGYNLDPQTNTIDTGKLAPIQINQSSLPATPTSTISFQGDLPVAPAAGQTSNSTVSVFDGAGASHQLELSWTPTANAADTYTLSISSPDLNNGASLGSATVAFNANGTLASVTPVTGLTGGANTDGATASVGLDAGFGGAAQPITLSLGTIGTSNGAAMSGSTYNLGALSANGTAVGNFTGVTINDDGDVIASYDNNQTNVIAQVPLATFTAADALQRQDGQAFTATAGSGAASLGNVNQDGKGSLVTGSVESSNTDISTDLTRLISAQQAYGANAKMVTTADQMMQTAISMVQ